MTPTDRQAPITGPHTPLTTTEQRVADGIFRNLSYAEIGHELAALGGKRGQPVTSRTVRQHVSNIALKLDGLERLAPRMRIYIWQLHRQYVARSATTH